MIEPFYIAQNGEPMTDDERRAWFQARAEDARKEGAQRVRFSIDPDRTPTLCLVEAWREKRGKDGSVRWQLTAA